MRAWILSLLFGLVISVSAEEKPNILFIAIDDMNDWTGFLGGHPQAQTPNMDRLAKRGVNFTNAHCVAPACGPSRTALLLGVEPSKSGLYPFYHLTEVPEEVKSPYTSLPQFLKKNGYETFGSGKIHHGESGLADEWTDYFKGGKKLNLNPEAGYQQGNSTKMAFCPTTNPLEDHPDYQVASYCADLVAKEHDKPFFVAVGIVKPHLAFVCPQQFFDLYEGPIEPPRIKPDDHSDIPWAGRAMAKIRDDVRFRKDEAWEKVHRSYLACISWADFNIGRVLDSLESGPNANNTVVVLWSDHGYHMGEKRSFRKFSLWEEATKVPFILWDTRDRDAPEGRESAEAVSLINIYRTLADMAGLEAPDYVDGVSLAGQLEDPGAKIKAPAMTTWGRGNYTLRSEDWRYTRYFDGSEELYSHADDPDEWTNVIENPEYAAIRDQLAAYLPDKEAKLVKEGISLWNVVDADRPNLKNTKSQWEDTNKVLVPPLGE